nr:hypothetical protein [Tanacetum cinerariifolium]
MKMEILLVSTSNKLIVENFKREWRYLIPAEPQIHIHMLIPDYQDIIFQDFCYSDGFECYQAIKIGRLNVNSDLQCVTCNGCIFSDNHGSCVLDFINNVNARVKSKSIKKTVKRKIWKPTGKVFTYIRYIWRPTGRTFTIVGNVCPLTRITTTAEVPLRKLIPLEINTPKPVVTLVYLRKLKASRNNVPVSKFKINKFLSANKREPNKSLGSTVSNVPSSFIDECRLSKLFDGI